MSKSINKKEWLDLLNKYISANHETMLALNRYAVKFNSLSESLKKESLRLRGLKNVSLSAQNAQAEGQAGDDTEQKISDTKVRISSLKSDWSTVKQQCYKFLVKACGELNPPAKTAMLYVNPELLAVMKEVGSIELQAPSVKAIAVTPPTADFFDYKAEAGQDHESVKNINQYIQSTMQPFLSFAKQFYKLKETAEGVQSAIKAIPEECIITLGSAGDIGELEVAPEAVLVEKDYFWSQGLEGSVFEGLKKDIASLSPDVKGFYIAGSKDEPHQLDSLTPRELFLLGIELGENPHIKQIGFAGWLSESVKYNAEFFTIGVTFARLMANKDAYYPNVQLQSREIEVFSSQNAQDHGVSTKIDWDVMNSKAMEQMTWRTSISGHCGQESLHVPSHLSNNPYTIEADSALIKVCKLLINPHISQILTNQASKEVINRFIDKCSDEAQRLIRYFLEADELHPGADCTKVICMLRPEQVVHKGCKIDLKYAWNSPRTPDGVEVDGKLGELFAEYPYNVDGSGSYEERSVTQTLRSALSEISAENVNTESEARKVIHELELGLKKDAITLEKVLKEQIDECLIKLKNYLFDGLKKSKSMVEEFKAYEKKGYLERSIRFLQQRAEQSVDEALKNPLKKAFKDKCAEAGFTLEELQSNLSHLGWCSAKELLNLDEKTFSSAAKTIKILIELKDMGILDLDTKGLWDLLGSAPDFMQYDAYLKGRGASASLLRDELLELPVELEPEVPAGSSGADLEAKADHEYLASLISPSAAENAVSAAAAAEPYVDPANPIGVAGHVDVPDLQ